MIRSFGKHPQNNIIVACYIHNQAELSLLIRAGVGRNMTYIIRLDLWFPCSCHTSQMCSSLRSFPRRTPRYFAGILNPRLCATISRSYLVMQLWHVVMKVESQAQCQFVNVCALRSTSGLGGCRALNRNTYMHIYIYIINNCIPWCKA